MHTAVNRNALDAEVTLEDRVRFIDMVRPFGGLPSDGPGTVGARTPRNNCLTPMKVESTCPAHPRLPINELLNSNFWQHRVNQPLEGEWQPTLFQAVGGMDKLVDAFTMRVGKTIRYNAEVIEVIKQPDGVQVVVRDRKTGKTSTVQSDYCISNMPMPKLVNVKSNLSDEFKQAVAQVRIPPTYKLPWQANRRFWDEPPYNIYGGISYTTTPSPRCFTGQMATRAKAVFCWGRMLLVRMPSPWPHDAGPARCSGAARRQQDAQRDGQRSTVAQQQSHQHCLTPG